MHIHVRPIVPTCPIRSIFGIGGELFCGDDWLDDAVSSLKHGRGERLTGWSQKTMT